MRRALVFASLLVVTGCVAPPAGDNETTQAEVGNICGPKKVWTPTAGLLIDSSASNPWKGHAGVIIYYPYTDETYTLYGVDNNQQLVWIMFDATYWDLSALQRYPESGGNCNGGSSNPGSGGGDSDPDPDIRGATCVPLTVWADARQCPFRGCLTCDDFAGRCGTFDATCGRTVTCGCSSGNLCGSDGVCHACHRHRCGPNLCGVYSDGCGGQMFCATRPNCFLK